MDNMIDLLRADALKLEDEITTSTDVGILADLETALAETLLPAVHARLTQLTARPAPVPR